MALLSGEFGHTGRGNSSTFTRKQKASNRSAEQNPKQMTDQERQQSVVNDLVTQSGKGILMCDLAPGQFNSSRNLLVRSNYVLLFSFLMLRVFCSIDMLLRIAAICTCGLIFTH